MAMKYDSTISLGNILSMATITFMVVGAVIVNERRNATLETKVETLSADIGRVERVNDARDSLVRSVIAGHDARIRSNETKNAGTDADIRAIQTGIARMERKLDELLQKGVRP